MAVAVYRKAGSVVAEGLGIKEVAVDLDIAVAVDGSDDRKLLLDMLVDLAPQPVGEDILDDEGIRRRRNP